MCGRYVVTNPVSKTKSLVKTAIKVDDKENYNAHPYQDLPVIKKYPSSSFLAKSPVFKMPLFSSPFSKSL